MIIDEFYQKTLFGNEKRKTNNCNKTAIIHVAENEINPSTAKKIATNPPKTPSPLAKNRTHHGNAAFGSCSACIWVCTPEAAAPIFFSFQ